MPRIVTHFAPSGWWFYYTVYGGRVREVHVPQPDRHFVAVLPLPEPMSVGEVNDWVTRENSIFLSTALRAYGDRRTQPERYTLQPLCVDCGNPVETLNRCARISNRRTCNSCRGTFCRSCDRHTCSIWVIFHPEHADTIRREEDPLGW